MLLNNPEESLIFILWPFIFYVPVLLKAFANKRLFHTYLGTAIIQLITPILLLIPSPSGNGTDMIGYGAVVLFIIGSQIFFIGITLLILFGDFFYQRYRKKDE